MPVGLRFIPWLKFIIGHMDKMLPSMLDQTFMINTKQGGWGYRERALQQVWDENMWITTTGIASLYPLACLMRVCKIGCNPYSVDYPFSANERGSEFIDEISKSEN